MKCIICKINDRWFNLIIGVTALILFVIVMSGCAQFPINAEQGTVTNQLNCEPAESDGCAGWLPPENNSD